MKSVEVIIIGAGPAGISAAIQLKRYGIEPVVFEMGEMGGLLRNANLVENYPGFPRGIPGQKLVSLFAKQFTFLNLKITPEEVLEVTEERGGFIVKICKGSFSSKCLIIASGTKPNLFTRIKFSEEVNSRLHYEVNHLVEKKGKTIVIVGGGDAAFDYALNLANENKVIIMNRTAETNCLPLLRDRVLENKSVKYLANSEINGINWNGSMLDVDVTSNGNEELIKADEVVFAIGRIPNLGFLSRQLRENLENKIKEGNLYLIGDVKNGLFRQASISVGNGVEVAMKIYMKKQEN